MGVAAGKLGHSTTARTVNFAVSKSERLTGLKSEVTSIVLLNRAEFNSIETLMSPYWIDSKSLGLTSASGVSSVWTAAGC